jgi:hypothetical protein
MRVTAPPGVRKQIYTEDFCDFGLHSSSGILKKNTKYFDVSEIDRVPETLNTLYSLLHQTKGKVPKFQKSWVLYNIVRTLKIYMPTLILLSVITLLQVAK